MDALLSSTTLQIACPLLLLFVGLKLFNNTRSRKKYHPVAGTFLHVLHNFPRLHDYISQLSSKYTTFRMISPFMNLIYTSDPADVEYILKTNFHNYGKGLYNYKNMSALLGDGIFTVDGEKWQRQRKLFSHEFSKRNLRDFSSQIFRENAAKLANMLADFASSEKVFDIQDLFMKCTLDSIFKVAFGVDLDNMRGSSEEGAKFCRAFDEASISVALRFIDVFWPIKKFLNVGEEAKFRENVKVVDNFVYKVIRNKDELVRKVNDTSMKKDDILSRFLELGDADPKYLRDIILNFVIAGKDTTAGTLTWFIYALCMHPDIQEKVSQEVNNATKVDKVSNYAEFVACLDEECLKRMIYLHAALNETLRLYPAVPVDPKVCFSDDILPDGFSVRKGDMVAYLPYAMGRMKSIWGDDAECFRPERWFNADGLFQQESPFKFTAFQAGLRICLGKDFAYRQMKIFSAVLLSSFQFRLGDPNKPVNYKTMISLHVDGGLHVQATLR